MQPARPRCKARCMLFSVCVLCLKAQLCLFKKKRMWSSSLPDQGTDKAYHHEFSNKRRKCPLAFYKYLQCAAQGEFFSRECSSQCVSQALSLGMRNVKRAQKEERAPTRWRGSANNKGLIRRLKQRNELQAARRADEDAAHLPREMSWSSVRYELVQPW